MKDKQNINTKTIARLAAVQVLYSMEILPRSTPKKAIADVVEYYANENNLDNNSSDDDKIILSYNKAFFTKLIDESIKNIDQSNKIILEYLKEPYNLTNTNSLLLAVLRVGLAEMIYITDTPIKVVINEFTNIASSFLGENDVAFVNAVLDSHAKLINENRMLVNAL